MHVNCTWIKEVGRIFALTDQATEWLIMLWQAIQVFDDIADGDPVSMGELNKTILNTLVYMNQNEFWRCNSNSLSPIIELNILKWHASETAERNGKADEKSFVWRAGFYDVILMVVKLCHGSEAAMKVAYNVLSLYGENFQEYFKEFNNA